MYSDDGIAGIANGLWVPSVVATRVAVSVALSNVYQTARYPGARSATAASDAALRNDKRPLASSAGGGQRSRSGFSIVSYSMKG